MPGTKKPLGLMPRGFGATQCSELGGQFRTVLFTKKSSTNQIFPCCSRSPHRYASFQGFYKETGKVFYRRTDCLRAIVEVEMLAFCPMQMFRTSQQFVNSARLVREG